MTDRSAFWFTFIETIILSGLLSVVVERISYQQYDFITFILSFVTYVQIFNIIRNFKSNSNHHKLFEIDLNFKKSIALPLVDTRYQEIIGKIIEDAHNTGRMRN